MESKNLLLYINSIHDGGAERVIIQLAHRFALAGYRSILVTSFVDKDEYPVPQNVKRISIEQMEIKQAPLKRNTSRIKALRCICKKYNPAAVIAFMAQPGLRAIIATIGFNAKTIISVRNDPKREYGGKIGLLAGKLVAPLADGCVFQTEDAKRWFPRKLQRKSEIIYNAVDERFFNTKRKTENGHIVSLGRLAPQKNQKLLINAFAEIVKEFPDEVLDISGKGPLQEELQMQIDNLELKANVFLKGLTDQSQEVLSKAKLFILSSDYEGMPNALMEAMAVGVPCISTDCPCGGPRMLIRQGINGILIPVNNEMALVEAIRHLLKTPERAESLGKNAKERAKEFAPEIIFTKWQKYIEKVISGK